MGITPCWIKESIAMSILVLLVLVLVLVVPSLLLLKGSHFDEVIQVVMVKGRCCNWCTCRWWQ